MAARPAPAASARTQAVRKSGDALPLAAIRDLRAEVSGDVLVRGEAGEDAYRAAIHRWNEAYITEASVIAFCESEEDVAACLRYVRDWDLDLAVAGGRHSYMGASSGRGLVIDLRRMRKVALDKAGMTIRAQGGCLAGDLERPADAEGLGVVFGIANDTGIAGITMGGGTGPFTGLYGTVSDNLLAARIVLADGRVMSASENENSDLFWAIRGCGPNFGVVTEFTYKLHRQEGPVFHGMLGFSPDKLDPLLALLNPLYDDVTECAGKLLFMIAFAVLPGSQGVSPLVLIFYDGPEEEARRHASPLFELGPIMNQCSMKRYPEVTVMPPSMAGPPTHQRYACRNIQMVPPLDINSIKGLAEDFAAFMTKYGASASPSKVILELRYSGITSSVPVNAMAYAGRRQTIFAAAEAQYDDASLDKTMRSEIGAMIDALRERVVERAGKPFDGVLVQNTNIGSGDERLQNMFGENLPRLMELKRKYDPGCVFNKWYPIILE